MMTHADWTQMRFDQIAREEGRGGQSKRAALRDRLEALAVKLASDCFGSSEVREHGDTETLNGICGIGRELDQLDKGETK